MGKMGERFIVHQCKRLGLDPDNLDAGALRKLADSAEDAAILVVGYKKASEMKENILKLAEDVEGSH